MSRLNVKDWTDGETGVRLSRPTPTSIVSNAGCGDAHWTPPPAVSRAGWELMGAALAWPIPTASVVIFVVGASCTQHRTATGTVR